MKKAIIASIFLLAFTGTAFGQLAVGCQTTDDRFTGVKSEVCKSLMWRIDSRFIDFFIAKDGRLMNIGTNGQNWVAYKGLENIYFIVDGKRFQFPIEDYTGDVSRGYRTASASEQFQIFLTDEFIIKAAGAENIEMKVGLFQMTFPGQWRMIFGLAQSYFKIEALPDVLPQGQLPFEKALGLIPRRQ